MDVTFTSRFEDRCQEDLCLTKNNHLMNGWKIVGSAFTASVKPLVQHGRASSKEFHSWPSHLKADLKAVVRKILTLEREEDNNHDKLLDATVLCHGPQEFSWVFWHFLRHGETITCEVTD